MSDSNSKKPLFPSLRLGRKKDTSKAPAQQESPPHIELPPPISHDMPTLTHSTDENPGNTSASGLARGAPGPWIAAAANNHCSLQTQPRPAEVLDAFIIKYPQYIKSPQFISQVESSYKHRDESLGYNSYEPSYLSWVNSLQQDQYEDADPYEVQSFGRTLLLFWESISRANILLGKEADIRRGPDNMLELAFVLRSNGKHHLQAERDIALPAQPMLAIADIITSMVLPYTWKDYLDTLGKWHLFASDPTESGRVITFAYEAKSNDPVSAPHQLAWYLCSAQHTRKALGFQGLLFGATLVGSTLTIYASEWNSNADTVHRFILTTFSSFLTCYIFLCKIADHMADEFVKVTNQWGEGQSKEKLKQGFKDAIDNLWLLSSESPRKCRCSHYDGGGGGIALAQDIDIEGEGHKGNLLTRANLQSLSPDEKSSDIENVYNWTLGLAEHHSDIGIV